ncbi:MAG: hypothetical protein AAF401_14025 [Pseudomonadota bacterium]
MLKHTLIAAALVLAAPAAGLAASSHNSHTAGFHAVPGVEIVDAKFKFGKSYGHRGFRHGRHFGHRRGFFSPRRYHGHRYFAPHGKKKFVFGKKIIIK